ncbi:hypothetical protein D5S17_16685 [Pseudonocardiaceae bacterium YIM PH 21723]|nr:hypothetical protein D5S17_16685 [Pseudonocardiaceae bacterium YIM PH 21723]
MSHALWTDPVPVEFSSGAWLSALGWVRLRLLDLTLATSRPRYQHADAGLLSTAELGMIEAGTGSHARLAHIAIRAELRRVLGTELDVVPERVPLPLRRGPDSTAPPSGVLTVRGQVGGCGFSVSSSRLMAVIATGFPPVGVHLRHLRTGDGTQTLTAMERRDLNSRDSAEHQVLSTMIGCGKYAVLAAIRAAGGHSTPIGVRFAIPRSGRPVLADIDGRGPAGMEVAWVRPDDQHILAVTGRGTALGTPMRLARLA